MTDSSKAFIHYLNNTIRFGIKHQYIFSKVKPLLHDQIFFYKLHVSNTFAQYLTSQFFAFAKINFAKIPNIHGQKNIWHIQFVFWWCKSALFTISYLFWKNRNRNEITKANILDMMYCYALFKIKKSISIIYKYITDLISY